MKTDLVKVKVVEDWPVFESRKQLQCFLGFANVYRLLIKNYSQVAPPVTSLTSAKVPFTWSYEAHTAFKALKQLFRTTPTVIHPDTSN